MGKLRIFLPVLFIQTMVFGQWHRINDPVHPGTASGTTFEIFPSPFLPIGNGKIIYTHLFHVGGGLSPTTINLYVSTNDLASATCALCPAVYKGQGAAGSIGLENIIAFDDSTLSWAETYLGYPYQRGQWSNFAVSKVQPIGTSAGVHLNTPNYLYSILQNTYTTQNGDTPLVVRTGKTSTVTSYIKLRKYFINNSVVDHGLRFLNDSIGYAFLKYRANNNKTALIKTTDYGNTWNELLLDSVNQIIDIDFPSVPVGYLRKTNNTVFKTTNGGLSWNQVSTPNVFNIVCLKFGNDTIGYIGGNSGELWKTTNGGATWVSEVTTCTNAIVSLYAFGEVAYFKDFANKLYKNSPDVVSVKKKTDPEIEPKLYPNPVNDVLNIELTGARGNIKVELYDLFGKKITEETINDYKFKLNVSEFNSGIYILNVKDSEEFIIRRINVIH